MIDIIGVLAGLFVVLAFYATDPVRLRQHALFSNILFIAYAAQLGLWPIVVLHTILLPLNWKRLADLHVATGYYAGALQMNDQEREVFVQGLICNPHCWAIYGQQRLQNRAM